MKILITNDDGIFAEGINVLAETLKENGHKITVVAPSQQQSATSHSITLFGPLKIKQIDDNKYSINGTPVDCVVLGSQVVCKEDFDLVISGINAGQNMGEDVFYSGTVSAALEALHFGYKAIAISLAAYKNQKFDVAAKCMAKLLEDGISEHIYAGMILNINIPNVNYEELRGIEFTSLGHRHYEDFITIQKNPLGQNIYWIGGNKPIITNKKGTDLSAVKNNYISITPIKPSFTDYKSLDKLKTDWEK